MKGKIVPAHFAISLCISMVLGVLTTVLIAGIGAYLIASELAGERSDVLCAGLAVLCGSFVSAAVATARERAAGAASGFAGGLAYFLALICGGVIAFDGVRGGVGLTLLLALCGPGVLWLLTLRPAKRRKIKLPKMHR